MLNSWYTYLVNRYISENLDNTPQFLPHISITAICGDKIDKWFFFFNFFKSFNLKKTNKDVILGL